MDADAAKKLGWAAVISAGLYAAYRVFSKKDSVPEALQKTVEQPMKVIDVVVDTVKEVAAPVTKAVKSVERKVRGKKKVTSHKGHATKRGLSQDQKRTSKEEWEKSYRRRKDHKGFDARYS